VVSDKLQQNITRVVVAVACLRWHLL